MTSTGLLLIPLGLVLVLLPWRYCLAGLMAFTMMSPAAVFNAGNFGLQPGYFLSLLLLGRVAVQIMADRFTFNRFVLGRMAPMLAFVTLTFVVMFIALCFFQGKVETLPGSAGFKSGMTRPFYLARENFTQLFYLLLNTGLIYVMGHAAARQTRENLPRALDTAITCGLVFSVAVCAWQFMSLYGGAYFPSDFFYSNAGYSRADSQSMVGLFRINGPFEEPSTLGYTFTGYLLYAWGRYAVRPTGTAIGMVVASVFCMLVSTSTTAFLGLFLFACVAVFDLATGRVRLIPRARDMTSGYVFAVTLIGAAILTFAIIIAANWTAISVILNNTVFAKTESTSFQQRSFADFLALRVFGETYGVGIGLGSHKANSLALTLLSNTGIAGLILFGLFAWSLLRPRRGLKAREGIPGFAYRRFQLGLAGWLAIHIFSNPNLSTLTLWVGMGGLLSLQVWQRGVEGKTIPARGSGTEIAAIRAPHLQASV